MSEQDLIEALAAEAHASWARWMAYLFSKCEQGTIGNPDELVIPAEYVKALQRQIDLPYSALTAQEQQHDRDEVAHILPSIQAYAATCVPTSMTGLGDPRTRVL
jgi:hypothetical protein